MNPDPFQLNDSIGTPLLVAAIVVYVAMFAFGVYLYCRVARKAGYSAWAGLWLLVPVANVVVMLIFAFSEWPIEREVKALRAQMQRSDAGHARFGTAPEFGSPVGMPGQAPPAFGAAPAGHGTPGYGAPGPGAANPTPHSGITPDPFGAPPSQP